MNGPSKELVGALKGLYSTGEWSDLTISCGGTDYRVHKSIVCPRSDFFAAACRGDFKEAREAKVNLPEDDPQAVELMVYYFYHLDYHATKYGVPVEQKRSIWTEPGPALLGHSKVYAIAEKYGIPGLKELARQKFRNETGDHWDDEAFLDATREAYTSTVEADRGLRDLVVETFHDHNELLDKEEAQAVIREMPMLAYDILMYWHSGTQSRTREYTE